MNYKIALTLAVLLLATATPAFADVETDIETCRSVQDDHERLACYDSAIDEAQVTEWTATIKDVEKTAYDKLVMTLDNGQVWRQVDNSRLVVSKGDQVVIRSAQFGSYLLEKVSGSRTIRVRRIDN